MHSFTDFSGCVFLNTYSGETLSVGLSHSALIKCLATIQGYDKSNSASESIITLVNKGFLRNLDVQSSNVE